MILRRITEHVTAQNWTAVALDFLIVVVGVFIGIQVSNWNDARQDRADEAIVLRSLHEEVVAVQNLSSRILGRERARQDRAGLRRQMRFRKTGGRPRSVKRPGIES